MVGVRALVQERLHVVGADAEDLDPARLHEVTHRANEPLPVQLPLVAVTGRKGEQRRSPVPEDRDAHVVPEPRGIPDVVFDAHLYGLLPGLGTRDPGLGAGRWALGAGRWPLAAGRWALGAGWR